ncbi:MAG: hypothetical protein OT477_09860 [Chloroflexi bacterium]|nr:hypothetical protein [Chloroflexota bacterium]
MGHTMLVAEKIHQRVHILPEPLQIEALDFVDFLLSRLEPNLLENIAEIDDLEWSTFSLAMAMRGMEDEESPKYTLDDLKIVF